MYDVCGSGMFNLVWFVINQCSCICVEKVLVQVMSIFIGQFLVEGCYLQVGQYVYQVDCEWCGQCFVKVVYVEVDEVVVVFEVVKVFEVQVIVDECVGCVVQ